MRINCYLPTANCTNSSIDCSYNAGLRKATFCQLSHRLHLVNSSIFGSQVFGLLPKEQNATISWKNRFFYHVATDAWELVVGLLPPKSESHCKARGHGWQQPAATAIHTHCQHNFSCAQFVRQSSMTENRAPGGEAVGRLEKPCPSGLFPKYRTKFCNFPRAPYLAWHCCMALLALAPPRLGGLR